MTYNDAEYEVVGLCIALEAVNSMVNHTLLKLRKASSCPEEHEVYFHSDIHQELFFIRLLDFVHEKGDCKLANVKGSCLQVLQHACKSCSFNQNGSIDALKSAVNDLDSWLKHEKHIALWLPTLEIEAKIKLSRTDIVFISVNQFKHNLSRLTGVTKRICKNLEKNKYAVQADMIPLALDDFREHLQEDYFVYYATWLTELLNNVRWGIQSYVEPVFLASYKENKAEDCAYWYEHPAVIQHDVPKKWFWRLMNNIRTKPYMKQFTSAHYLKKSSSLE
jgi:hypothetical protein